jgi:hypothetical protein
MKLKITLDSGVYFATLADNPTSRSFWEQLPLSSELSNYGSNEKRYICKTNSAPTMLLTHIRAKLATSPIMRLGAISPCF